jgi:hypothetical protein
MPITFFIACLAAWLRCSILVTAGGAGLDRRQGARAAPVAAVLSRR